MVIAIGAEKTHSEARGAKFEHPSTLDPEIDGLPADWQALADAGRERAEVKTSMQWQLGDLVCRVLTAYSSPDAPRGEQSRVIKEFSSEIAVNASSLRVYHGISKFYPYPTRDRFPNLSYDHFKTAKRLGDLDSALAILEKASADNWSSRDLVDAVRIALQESPVRRPLYEGTATCARVNGKWMLVLDEDAFELSAGLICDVKVWESAA